ncbi:FAD-binding domain-containing protein [Aspergillus japonicus CBS 114.51]|uniref:FAD-binding domain-containing protein n=2 Tax=Aspergillus TaxID=5052 RepID=A0A2V5GVJ6_ASPV1|nr:FAD-binding domain-containing protein [Aspergillus japonicus CBS 114.51]PYI13104.1 FAD-binding domain-containing protein [Aspergillus violaceofuscus CBS 115571]RAH80343.1 FAD-binding domain-containing protein [Aspergillus japonicus CBS 114.51]
MRVLSTLGVAALAGPAVVEASTKYTAFETCLRPLLSSKATILNAASTVVAPRWTEYDEPVTDRVVNVATEADVQATVFCANAHDIPFLAQGGGNAWSTTWTLTNTTASTTPSILINLRALNAITFSPNRTTVTVQGGALISELLTAAYAHDAQVVTANCDCVGVMGALLGGGYSRMMGERGYMIDNVVSLNVVLATGARTTVTASSHPDLWWALRGAGANFGVVTSAIFRSYPTARAENHAWLGSLVFSADKLEALVGAINALPLTSQMAVFLYFATTGAPDYTPAVIAFPFYLARAGANTTTAEARAAFATILALGPLSDTTAWTPYDQVNAGSASFCAAGGRKVSLGSAQQTLDPAAWRAIWTSFTRWVEMHGGEQVGNSTVLMEAYSLDRARAVAADSSAYAWRASSRFNTVAIAWYQDPALDAAARQWAGDVRAAWRATSGLSGNATYINFAFGDESLEDIYGDNVERLRSLKRVYDPKNRFNQFFPLV